MVRERKRYICALAFAAAVELMILPVIQYLLPSVHAYWMLPSVLTGSVRFCEIWLLPAAVTATQLAVCVRRRFLPCLPLLLTPLPLLLASLFFSDLPGVRDFLTGKPYLTNDQAFAVALVNVGFGVAGLLLLWPVARLALRVARRPWPASFAAAGLFGLVSALLSLLSGFAVSPIYAAAELVVPPAELLLTFPSTLFFSLEQALLWCACLGALLALPRLHRVPPLFARLGRAVLRLFDVDAHQHIGE